MQERSGFSKACSEPIGEDMFRAWVEPHIESTDKESRMKK